jgi:ADP-heptose:LPS heptosyltransferase
MPVQRILIFRPDNIGDVVLFSGALKHIRKRYPGTHITLAVKEHIVNLVELCPYIDKCISLEDLSWWHRLKNIPVPYIAHLKKIVRRLDRYWKMITKPFNFVIYPVKSPQEHNLPILYDLGIKKIYGIVGCAVNMPQGGYPEHLNPRILFSDYLDVSKEDPWRHEFVTTLDFLKFIGCEVSDITDIKPEMWVSDFDKNLLENERTNGRKIIGLFPGGSFKQKCWSPENYEALAELMPNDVSYVIFGGLGDVNIAHEVELYLKKGSLNIKVINLVGKTNLRELYKTISSCNIVVSMDTSGLHLSIAAGTPSVLIAGGWHYGRFIPWGDPQWHVFLTKKLDCFYCNVNCKMDRFECIQGVTPEEVYSNINNLLVKKRIFN